MLRRALIAAAPLALLALPALAAEEGKPNEAGQYVDLSPVALPIVVDGQLVNYVFVSVRVVLTSAADVGKMRALEPYFRDALVKISHRTPFTSAKDYVSIDTGKLKAAMFQEAVRLAGPRNVQSIAVLSQAPKRRKGIPVPNSGGAAPEVRP
jgi:hypothetical protein